MTRRLAVRLAAAGAVFAVAVTAVSGFAAANTVAGSLAGVTEQPQGANDQKPAECGSLDLGGKVAGSGTFSGTAGNDLVLGSGAVDTIGGGGGDDCIVAGDGADTIDGGAGTDVCIGGPAGATFANCETQH